MGVLTVAGSPPSEVISDWQKSGAAERANYALFLTELCDILSVPRPEPTQPDNSTNAYVFERSVTIQHLDGTSSNRAHRSLQARLLHP